MDYLRAKKLLSTTLRRERSETGSSNTTSVTPTDQQSREEKSAPYRNSRYPEVLQTKRSFMEESEPGIAEESGKINSDLLHSKKVVRRDSLFRDDLFKKTCHGLLNRNENRILRDITPLVVPAAEILAIYGDKKFECLIESINEGWNNSMPLTGEHPQPDYSVGFRRGAFAEDQLNKLSPFIGDRLFGDQSYFMATRSMHFPFLTCEVESGAAGLEIADRQNTHSMTLAVRAVNCSA